MEFPDDGEIWIDFCYEGQPNYCLIFGKIGHVTQWCKEETLGEMATTKDMKAMYAFNGLDMKFDLWGNWLAGRGHQLRQGLGDMYKDQIGRMGRLYHHLEGDSLMVLDLFNKNIELGTRRRRSTKGWNAREHSMLDLLDYEA